MLKEQSARIIVKDATGRVYYRERVGNVERTVVQEIADLPMAIIGTLVSAWFKFR